MTEPRNDETSPDDLMKNFRGRSLKSIVVFTIVIHAILLIGTSVPFLMKSVMGKDTSKMSEDERIELAVSEANKSLREIAEQHGLNVQDISNQFAASETKAPTRTAAPEPAPVKTGDPDEPKSAIEKELDVEANGPELPKVEDDEEDLFK